MSKVLEDTIIFISGKIRFFLYILVYFIILILYESVTVDTSKEWKVKLENSLWLSISCSLVFSFSVAEAVADHSVLHPLHPHLAQLLLRHTLHHPHDIPVGIDGYKQVIRGLTQDLLVATLRGSCAVVFERSD